MRFFDNILVLGLNAAIDTVLYLDRLVPGAEHIVARERSDVGGKGPTLSRALSTQGIAHSAVILAGADNFERLKGLYSSPCGDTRIVALPGSTRENITIDAPPAAPTRFIRGGFSADPDDFERFTDNAVRRAGPGTLAVLGGRLPGGVTAADVTQLAERLRGCGAQIVLDTASLSLAETTALAPDMIKPNEAEFAALVGASDAQMGDTAEIARLATAAREQGVGELIVSLGARGLVYVGEHGVRHVAVPQLTPVCDVGAGDTVLGFFLGKLLGERDHAAAIDLALRTAAAAGSAACLTQGNSPPQREAVDDMLKHVGIRNSEFGIRN